MSCARLKGLVLAGLLAGASLAMAANAEAMPVNVPLPVGVVSNNGTVPLDYAWDRVWLQGDSYVYNHGLARICGAISSTVYLQGDTAPEHRTLMSAGLGIEARYKHLYSTLTVGLPFKKDFYENHLDSARVDFSLSAAF